MSQLEAHPGCGRHKPDEPGRHSRRFVWGLASSVLVASGLAGSGLAGSVLVAASLAGVLAGACSGSTPKQEDAQTLTTTGVTSGSGGTGGASASGGTGGASVSGGGSSVASAAGGAAGAAGARADTSAVGGASTSGDPQYPDVSFHYDPSLDLPPKTCVEDTLTAPPLPLDMYVVLDRTQSMSEGGESSISDCDVQFSGLAPYRSKWCLAVNALGKYFASESARGHRAALQFMSPGVLALPDAACLPGDANPHTRAAVDLTLLPENAQGPLIQALNAERAGSGSTEIESALNGIVEYTSLHHSPPRKMIGVLVTDGDPVGVCEMNPSLLGRIPADHYLQTEIPTFIIGMTGARFELLEAMATQGGSPAHAEFCDPADPSPTCHYWSVGDGDPDAFVAALGAIQESVVGCAYTVPASQDGLVSLDSLSVDFKANSAATPRPLKAVADEAACESDAFYTTEVEAELHVIHLCPSTCEEATQASQVQVRLECQGE